MVTRRVFTCTRRDAAARALVMTEEALAAPGPDEVLVRVAASVVDPEPLLTGPGAGIPEVAFVGTIQNGSAPAGLPRGTWVTGVGPLADVVTVPASRLRPLAADTGLPRDSMALLPVVSSLAGAVGDAGMTPGDRVMISGRGLTARLAAQLVEVRIGQGPQTFSRPPGSRDEEVIRSLQKAGEVDVLIDTTADAAWWSKALALVGRMGRVLLLVPPGPQVQPFDFYQRVHRGSLSMLARRVPSPYRPLAASGGSRLVRLLLGYGLVSTQGLLSAVRVDANGSSGSSIDLSTVAEGMGLVVRFDDRG